ncbi:hypothetical protein HK099_007052 [Clydaea vesicula]|uniref:Uncharacterized protein n=1 Tax=Clydaea vesicula TaxID=447962 RepID=A0AAD5TXD5_9FUNG|nr:hypothetical protein HK099_007052 [Clydaea vesicula]
MVSGGSNELHLRIDLATAISNSSTVFVRDLNEDSRKNLNLNSFNSCKLSKSNATLLNLEYLFKLMKNNAAIFILLEQGYAQNEVEEITTNLKLAGFVNPALNNNEHYIEAKKPVYEVGKVTRLVRKKKVTPETGDSRITFISYIVLAARD